MGSEFGITASGNDYSSMSTNQTELMNQDHLVFWTCFKYSELVERAAAEGGGACSHGSSRTLTESARSKRRVGQSENGNPLPI